MKPLSNLAKIERAAAPTFKAAAPDTLLWAQERQFFEVALRNAKGKPHGRDSELAPVIWDAIEAGVEDTIESAKHALRVIASMGLSLNPILAHVYLVPRRARTKRPDERWDDYHRNVPWLIHPWPSYRGLVYIATNYCSALDFAAEVVFAGDVFEPQGPFKIPTHRPTRVAAERTYEKAEGVYAAARLQTQGQILERSEYIDAATVERIRALSDMPNSLMWHPTKLWTEGWKKAACRRLCKLTLNAAPRMAVAEGALQRIERYTFDNDTGEVVGTGTDVPCETAVEHPEDRPKRGVAALRARLREASRAAAEAEEAQAEAADADAATILPIEDPAPSLHPPGSPEWWIDQIRAVGSLDELDALIAKMLEKRLDTTDEYETYRAALLRRRNELRAAL